MATEGPQPGPADTTPNLPEKIAPADLETLNLALVALFQELRSARSLQPGATHGRLRSMRANGRSRSQPNKIGPQPSAAATAQNGLSRNRPTSSMKRSHRFSGTSPRG
jgi:hypothetical protein